MKTGNKEIKLYDENDTTYFIDKTKPKSLKDLGFKLPAEQPPKELVFTIPVRIIF